MIDSVMTYLGKELEATLAVTDPSEIVLGALHTLDKSSGHPTAAISLVNVEEETTLRNSPHHFRVGDQSFYKEPPVHLNLYVLFSFSASPYAKALDHLSKTVLLFQIKRLHDASNASVPGTFPAAVEQLAFDLQSMKFDELNHLWGAIGTSYFPSVLYRVRLLRMQVDVTTPATEVETIELGVGEVQ